MQTTTPIARFDAAFKALIDHEGGYVNHPKDPGGETKFGISKRSYPTLDIAALTLAALLQSQPPRLRSFPIRRRVRAKNSSGYRVARIRRPCR